MSTTRTRRLRPIRRGPILPSPLNRKLTTLLLVSTAVSDASDGPVSVRSYRIVDGGVTEKDRRYGIGLQGQSFGRSVARQ